MAQAKTYKDYLIERQVAVDETVAELGLKPNSKEMRLFKNFVANSDEYNRLMFNGDVQSRHMAVQLAQTFNNQYYDEIHRLQASKDPADRASAASAQEAVGVYSGKMRGPSIIDRFTKEPYYTKEEGWKAGGLVALAGGLGVGALIANGLGVFAEGLSLMALAKAAAITVIAGLTIGGIVPTAVSWLGEQFSGEKKSTANTQGKAQEKSQGKTQEKSLESVKENTTEKSQTTKQKSTEISSEDLNYTRRADHIPHDVRQAATQAVRGSVTHLGGGGNGVTPNIGDLQGQPARYGANFYSSTAVPPNYNYGGYSFGANNVSPTSILPNNGNAYGGYGGYGNNAGYGNNLNYSNTGYGGYGAQNNGYGGYGYGSNAGYSGSFMTNANYYHGSYGPNFGANGPAGLGNGFASPPNRINGVIGALPNVGGFNLDESQGMRTHANGGALSGYNENAFNPLAIQPQHTPHQHQNHGGRHQNVPRGH